jgi:hypothetical protein
VFCVFTQICRPWRLPRQCEQALAQWQHPVASSEAQDVLHWVMRPASHLRIHMAIKITSDLPAFFVFVDFVVCT